MTDTDRHVLVVRNLVTTFRTERGVVRAVDDVSFDVPTGGKVGLVGESGSGKSVTALSILRLVDDPPGRIERGEVLLEGRDLMKLPERELRRVRGDRLAMVFQEPMTSLNPVMTVGAQIVETIRAHRDESRRQARDRAVHLLRRVGIPAPEARVDAWPHELSGGMRQRVMIAIALSCSPRVLIADEPTTSLDVTVQAQVLELLDEVRRESGMATLLISHDLGVVASFADQVVVMYAGRVVETGPVRDLFHSPGHPYTQALIDGLKALTRPDEQGCLTPRKLPTLPGRAPDRTSLPRGCRFQDRCERVFGACREQEPGMRSITADHAARCWLVGGEST